MAGSLFKSDRFSSMITIKRYYSIEEAELGRSLLESHGIRAFIPNSATQANLPFISMFKSGISLEVNASDAEEACRLLGVDKIPAPAPAAWSVDWMILFFLLVGVLIGFAIWSSTR